MIPARAYAGDGARSEAAEAVGLKPFVLHHAWQIFCLHFVPVSNRSFTLFRLTVIGPERKELLRSSLVSRPTGTKGRVVESDRHQDSNDAFRTAPKLSTRGVARVVADDAQMLCLALERVVPSCPTNPVV